MRLDFTILWIDDQPKHVNSFAEGLRARLGELGFELHVITVESLAKVDAHVGNHIHQDGIDLVLVDFDLGSGDGGDQALVKVRKRFPYKEIVFYSAMDTEKLRTIAYKTKVDGVRFSTRISLVSDTTEVINNLLSKVLDIDHMRGVVMSASSDIDYLVEESLLAVYGRLDPNQQKVFREELVADLQKKLVGWEKDLTKADTKDDLTAILKLKHLCSAADRLNTLLDRLSSWANDASTYLETGKVYRDDVVPRRNKLAHVMVKHEKGVATLIGSDAPIDLDAMTKLRCDLIEHRQNFQNIAVLVDVKF